MFSPFFLSLSLSLSLSLIKQNKTKKSVRQLRTALESEFNCDLGSHKALLRETVDAFLAEKQPKEEEVAPAAEEEAAAAAAAASASASEDEEEEDGDDGEEPAPKKAKTSAAKKGKGAKKGGAAGGSTKGGGGFQKPLKLSPAMQEFTGEERLSRAQIVKKCWVRSVFFVRFVSVSFLSPLSLSLSLSLSFLRVSAPLDIYALPI